VGTQGYPCLTRGADDLKCDVRLWRDEVGHGGEERRTGTTMRIEEEPRVGA
jgi:hypothetical protein